MDISWFCSASGPPNFMFINVFSVLTYIRSCVKQNICFWDHNLVWCTLPQVYLKNKNGDCYDLMLYLRMYLPVQKRIKWTWMWESIWKMGRVCLLLISRNVLLDIPIINTWSQHSRLIAGFIKLPAPDSEAVCRPLIIILFLKFLLLLD